MVENGSSEALLAFWFGDDPDDADVATRQAKLWWSKDDALDRLLRERFGAVLQQAGPDGPTGWAATFRGRLATVILFDQVSRNIYRGTAQAFAWDGQAREQARAALALGDEARSRPIERVFLYMPFEHAEDLDMQNLSVERFEALVGLAPEGQRPVFQGFLEFALRHRDIIRRFGRFPHRNALLGRPSSAEEIEFLKTPGSSF